MLLGFLLLGVLTNEHPENWDQGFWDETDEAGLGEHSDDVVQLHELQQLQEQLVPAAAAAREAEQVELGLSGGISAGSPGKNILEVEKMSPAASSTTAASTISMMTSPAPTAPGHDNASSATSATSGTRRTPLLRRDHHPTPSSSSNLFWAQLREMGPRAKERIRKYILLKTFMSSLLALGVGITLLAVQVDFWFVFTVLAFLLNFIPTVGGAISLIAPTVVTFLDPTKSAADIVVVLALPGALHILCGNVLEPYFFGSSFELHPIVIMFCLVVWSSLWGVVGAVLSVPLTCCLKLALEPHILSHPYALIAFRAMEFRLPNEGELPEFTPRHSTVVVNNYMAGGGGRGTAAGAMSRGGQSSDSGAVTPVEGDHFGTIIVRGASGSSGGLAEASSRGSLEQI